MTSIRIRSPLMFRRPIAIAQQRVDNVAERYQDKFLVRLLVRTTKEFIADDATHMAAAISYYALLSLFPMVIGLIAILSFFWQDDAAQHLIINWMSDFLPGSADFINQEQISRLIEARGPIGLFALVGMFWTASAIFGGITRSINRAWDVDHDRPLYISKPYQMLMALATGLLFLLSTSINIFLGASEQFASANLPIPDFLISGTSSAILYASSFTLMFAVFMVLYKYVPNTKTYWRYIWPGALVAAVLFEITENLFIIYLSRFANFGNIYGALEPVIIVLIWSYLSGLILILGAELSSEYCRIRRGVERGSLR